MLYWCFQRFILPRMKYTNLPVATSLRLGADDAAWLAAVSERERRPKGEIVRFALRHYRSACERGSVEQEGNNAL
jgi:hypothetical protein